jgi:hypothetical protein
VAFLHLHKQAAFRMYRLNFRSRFQIEIVVSKPSSLTASILLWAMRTSLALSLATAAGNSSIMAQTPQEIRQSYA